MEEPIRVLRVVARMDRGGLETTIMNTYRLIDRKKLQFDFVVHTEEESAFDQEILSLGGRIYRVPRYNALNHRQYLKAWDRFFRAYREYRIIHGHVRSTAAIYLRIAKKHGLTTIAHSHNTSYGAGFSVILKKLLQQKITSYADYLFACSTPAGQWLFGRDVIDKNNFTVVPNGIDAEKYGFNPRIRHEVRSELGIGSDTVLGHVGSFDQQKNHGFLVTVFEQVNNAKPGTVLLMVGDGILEIKERVASQVERSGLSEQTIMTGSRNDVHRLLQAMDCFVFPSHFEGFGNAVTEAQAAGLPCLVSDTVPRAVKITDLVDFLPLSQGAEQWAAKIIDQLEKHERINRSAEIIAAGYDIKPLAKWYEDFYLEKHNAS
jgi:glycosyltransferase involved in cell wall biosynthesis